MPTTTILQSPLSRKRYGVTERKKAELDALTLQVVNAQGDVQQYQSIVNSLTEKLISFQGFLAAADAARAQAYTNKTLANQLSQSALDLMNNAQIAFNAIVDADAKTQHLAVGVKQVISKLIYTSDAINKLSLLVVRKKALNPLISDELVTLIGTAGKDANSAVALTLVALKATFTALATNLESEASLDLVYLQAVRLWDLLKGSKKGSASAPADTSIVTLLDNAYTTANKNHQQTEMGLKMTTSQLNKANFALHKAQVKLASLQSGLAAANAAALAS